MSEMSTKSRLTIDPDAYMSERVERKIDLYRRLSRRNRYGYNVVSALAIALAASVPVAVNFFDENLIPTVLSLVLTVLVGLEKLFLFREHWKNYDLAEESLRREKYLFQTRSGVYSVVGDEDESQAELDEMNAFRLFVQRFEERIHEERAETIEARTQGLDHLTT